MWVVDNRENIAVNLDNVTEIRACQNIGNETYHLMFYNVCDDDFTRIEGFDNKKHAEITLNNIMYSLKHGEIIYELFHTGRI